MRHVIIFFEYSMRTRNLPFAILVILAALAIFISLPANPTQGQAYYYTPTPGSDGVILYTVRNGDTCGSIALINMVDQGTLETLNGLSAEDCAPGSILVAGTRLILGTVTAPTEAPATPTPTGPTPTVSTGSGRLCIYLYHDANSNGVEDTGEPPVAGAQAEILSSNGEAPVGQAPFISYSDGDVSCSGDLPEGTYTLNLSLPEGYVATTTLQQTVQISSGQTLVIRFGAVVSLLAEPTPGDSGGSSTALIAILGGLLILAGIGLGAFFVLYRRRA